MSSHPASDAVSYGETLRVREACLCLQAQRAARALARRFDVAFRPVQLTNQQFSLLMSLNRPHPATMAQIAAALAMDRTSLTAALKPLERRGLVQAVLDAEDARARRLSLRAAGRRLLARALPIWKSTHAEIERVLTPGARGSLRGSLSALAEAGGEPMRTC